MEYKMEPKTGKSKLEGYKKMIEPMLYFYGRFGGGKSTSRSFKVQRGIKIDQDTGETKS